jgi:hypothetical protein
LDPSGHCFEAVVIRWWSVDNVIVPSVLVLMVYLFVPRPVDPMKEKHESEAICTRRRSIVRSSRSDGGRSDSRSAGQCGHYSLQSDRVPI